MKIPPSSPLVRRFASVTPVTERTSTSWVMVMTNQHGRRYEHVLAGDLDDVTTEDVWTTTSGYSGNAAYDDCDLVITVSPKFQTTHEPLQYNVEAKDVTRGEVDKRVSDAISGSSSDESGIEELQRLVEGTPEWGEPAVAISFNHRKLLVVDALYLLWYVSDGASLALQDSRNSQSPQETGNGDDPVPPTVETVLDAFEPTLTPSENISMVKPESSVWPSATSSRPDEVVLADKLGLPHTHQSASQTGSERISEADSRTYEEDDG